MENETKPFTTEFAAMNKLLLNMREVNQGYNSIYDNFFKFYADEKPLEDLQEKFFAFYDEFNKLYRDVTNDFLMNISR